MAHNFGLYARKCLFIRQKSGKTAPFVLNAAQKHVHKALETQISEQGYVRALIVKGRQQGCSTYVAGRFFWKSTHRRGINVFILSHLEAASRNLADMVRRFHAYCPAVMRPVMTRSNRQSIKFGHMDSGYRIGTARSSGVGRSDTIQLFHGSEVAFWPNGRQHLSGILQTIPDGQDTEVILESTSDGPQGVFYDMCKQAQYGESDFQVIFVPWFLQDEYQRPVPKGFVLDSDESAYQKHHQLNIRQMVWRRRKISELGGILHFRREYPATLEEAFHADVKGALWTRGQIESNRIAAGDCPEMVRIVVAIDPAVSRKTSSDETGIIVAGLGQDGDGYVLEDQSARLSPAGWASRAVELYHRYQADRIVVETNQGGDMAVHTLRTADRNVAIKKLHASRGKWTRAEPVAALDEQGRIHHVGQFTALEDQMCRFKPGNNRHSPDRVDARVWAMTELMLGQNKRQPQAWNI
tara:strand:+ start:1644 stop:3044 length:1401 start_codon:yes stop_codon:yes gene_type:complete